MSMSSKRGGTGSVGWARGWDSRGGREDGGFEKRRASRFLFRTRTHFFLFWNPLESPFPKPLVKRPSRTSSFLRHWMKPPDTCQVRSGTWRSQLKAHPLDLYLGWCRGTISFDPPGTTTPAAQREQKWSRVRAEWEQSQSRVGAK